MRLINIYTRQLEEFSGANIPPYYILSHTWASDEISFQDYTWLLNYEAEVEEGIIDELSPKQRARIQAKAKLLQERSGCQKISSFIELARRFPRQEGDLDPYFQRNPGHFLLPAVEGSTKESSNPRHLNMDKPVATDVDYVWIDTCCINKESSAELSEAINSMFMWYQKSRVCIVFLPDVDGAEVDSRGGFIFQTRWFTRGWTLQELLAPRILLFYDKEWDYITKRISIENEIKRRTEMQWTRAGSPDLDVSISRRMSWAANRETTRIEDQAYCLMGIFGVNMPLLYGEGEQAFRRLQREIASMSADLSIFAWGFDMPSIPSLTQVPIGMFAQSPAAFSNGHFVAFIANYHDHQRVIPFNLTNVGLEMVTTLVRPVLQDLCCRNTFLVMEAVFIPEGILPPLLAIPIVGCAVDGVQLEHVNDGTVVFRAFGHPVRLPKEILAKTEHRVRRRVIVDSGRSFLRGIFDWGRGCQLGLRIGEGIQLEVYECWPKSLIYQDNIGRSLVMTLDRGTDAVILRFSDKVDQPAPGDLTIQYTLVLYLSDRSRTEGFCWKSALIYRWEDFDQRNSWAGARYASIVDLMCDQPGLAHSAGRRPSDAATTRYRAEIVWAQKGYTDEFLVHLSLANGDHP